MGREIRRVPANWQHPKDYRGFIPLKYGYEKQFNDFEKDVKEKGLREAIEYWGGGPVRDEYVDYEGKPCTWWQVYETVTEGTPVSPAFETKEELIDYLSTHGDFWAQKRDSGPLSKEAAEALVNGGWAPSAMIMNGKLYENAEGLVIK